MMKKKVRLSFSSFSYINNDFEFSLILFIPQFIYMQSSIFPSIPHAPPPHLAPVLFLLKEKKEGKYLSFSPTLTTHHNSSYALIGSQPHACAPPALPL